MTNATQTPVIFLIRTRRLPWRATPARIALAVTSLGALAAVTVAYLVAAEATKQFATAVPEPANRSRIGRFRRALRSSTRGLAKMEVMASQRDDFVVGRMIARLSVEVARLVRVRTLFEVLQQQCLLVSGTDKQDRFAVLQRLIDTRKERRIVLYLAGTDGIGLVMQMIGGKIRINRLFVDRIKSQKEDLGDTMIDPDNGVVVNSHGISSLCKCER